MSGHGTTGNPADGGMSPALREASQRHHRRWMAYLRGAGPGNGALVVTPRQRRRIKHKLGHMATMERREADRG